MDPVRWTGPWTGGQCFRVTHTYGFVSAYVISHGELVFVFTFPLVIVSVPVLLCRRFFCLSSSHVNLLITQDVLKHFKIKICDRNTTFP